MAGFTSGKWTVKACEYDRNYPDGPRYDPFGAKVMVYSNDDCESHPIADFSCNYSCRDNVECEANAVLASAAPELYEALVEAARYIEGYRDMPVGIKERINVALTKANPDA